MRFSPARVTASLLVAAVAFLAAPPASAIQSDLPPELEDLGDVILVPDLPPTPTVNTCSVGPAGKRLVCYEPFTDAWGNSQMRLCVYSDVLGYAMPWYTGFRLGCVETADWAFAPVGGICVSTLVADPTACVNNNIEREDEDGDGTPEKEACFLWTAFFRVCDDPSY